MLYAGIFMLFQDLSSIERFTAELYFIAYIR